MSSGHAWRPVFPVTPGRRGVRSPTTVASSTGSSTGTAPGSRGETTTQQLPLLDAIPSVRGRIGRSRRRPDSLFVDRGYDHDAYRDQARELGILVMDAMASGQVLDFKLYATGDLLHVDGAHLTLISAGLNSVTLIAGFVVFDAVRKAVAFDRRLVFAGCRQSTLIGAKALAVAVVAAAIALYTALAILLFWRPTAAGWLAVLAGFAVIALTYGSLGLVLGVLVKRDLEGFFLIIMGGLMDTFLQNPLGNPLANKPVLQWFPSFGPMQFAVGSSFGHTALWGHLALGLAWAVAFGAVGLVVFRFRTRNRTRTG